MTPNGQRTQVFSANMPHDAWEFAVMLFWLTVLLAPAAFVGGVGFAFANYCLNALSTF